MHAGALKLFKDQSVLLSKTGDEVRIQCESESDAEIVLGWLESLAEPEPDLDLMHMENCITLTIALVVNRVVSEQQLERARSIAREWINAEIANGRDVSIQRNPGLRKMLEQCGR